MKYILFLLPFFVQTTFAQNLIGKKVAEFEKQGKFSIVQKAKHPDFMKYPVTIGGKKRSILFYKDQSGEVITYKGAIKGRRSLASLTISGKDTFGIVSDYTGNYQITGKKTHKVKVNSTFSCATKTETIAPKKFPVSKSLSITDVSNKCVYVMFELKNDLYIRLGSMAACSTYAQGLFNQIQAIYANDGINLILKTIKIWNVPDPYTGTTSDVLLSSFIGKTVSYNQTQGDIFMLMGLAGSGGMAGVDGLCSIFTSPKKGYCAVRGSYLSYPYYSWDAAGVGHEMGHTLGSVHTHDCSWNGNNTEIDGCGDHAGYKSGSCPTVADPVNGGTLMSYCHLRPCGMNFSLGLGDQVAGLIKKIMFYAPCLATCGTVQPPTIPVNKAPIVTIAASKSNDSTYIITSNVTDENLSLITYFWFASGTSITGNATVLVRFPYTMPSGAYSYYCICVDDHGLKDTSNVVTINYTKPVTPPPGTGGSCNYPYPVVNGVQTVKELDSTQCNLHVTVTQTSTTIDAGRDGLTNCTFKWCKNGVWTTLTSSKIPLTLKGDVIECWFRGTVSAGVCTGRQGYVKKKYILP